MTENHHMQLPQRAKPFEWNLNTVLGLITLGTVIVTGGYWLNDNDRDIGELQKWRSDHESNVREIRSEISADIARVETQTSTLDDRLDVQEATTSRLSDRVSANEARSAEFAQTLRELQSAINQQSGDIRVIRSWIETQPRPGGKP